MEHQEELKPTHFKGKEAIEHVVEAQAKGLLSSAEIHGTEIPGDIFAGCDAAREAAVFLLAIWILLYHTGIQGVSIMKILGVLTLSLVVWKAGRSAWLAWARLERMHRVVEQEKWEIQHHRQQERDELKELYRAKGFNGKLLEDVMDVLMADEERLLRVMVEEELCLSLGTQEHPLKQALGAAIGTVLAAAAFFTSLYVIPFHGAWIGSFITIAIAAAASAYFEQNRRIPAIVWNLGLGALTCGMVYFLIDYINS